MRLPALHAIGWLLVLATLARVGFVLPAQTVDETGAPSMGGAAYLIFFFHFPSAFNCLNIFVFAGAIALVDLLKRQRDPRLDLAAATGIEIGVLACTVTLVTGSIWAKAAWNMFWDFRDLRLMTVAIMWFTYIGYLVLRTSIEEDAKRARFCAVFAVIAAVNSPIVYFIVKWFGPRSHPTPDPNIMGTPDLNLTQWLGALAFFIVYVGLWRIRYRTLWTQRECDRLESELAQAGC
jgi:heme exporter protein C